jgi:Cu/Ag efflux pump CusA
VKEYHIDLDPDACAPMPQPGAVMLAAKTSNIDVGAGTNGDQQCRVPTSVAWGYLKKLEDLEKATITRARGVPVPSRTGEVSFLPRDRRGGLDKEGRKPGRCRVHAMAASP